MAESSPLQYVDELPLLQTALENPFEPTEIPLSSGPTTASVLSPPPSTPTPPLGSIPSGVPPAEDDTWQTAYASQVSEWRAQSASVHAKAELTRAKWEGIRVREEAERQALGQPPESLDDLGAHITAATAAASEVVARSLSASVASLESVQHPKPHEHPEESAEHATQHDKADIGSPSQRWEHLSSPTLSSYPSMSFPGASVPQSPSPQPAFLQPTLSPAPAHTHPEQDQNPTYAHVPPSSLPSIMDNRVAPRTRLSLVLSSLAINLLLPFINGVMLGFGEIFAKDVVIGWFGWKTRRHGSTAAGLGLRR